MTETEELHLLLTSPTEQLREVFPDLPPFVLRERKAAACRQQQQAKPPARPKIRVREVIRHRHRLTQEELAAVLRIRGTGSQVDRLLNMRIGFNAQLRKRHGAKRSVGKPRIRTSDLPVLYSLYERIAVNIEK